MIGMQNNDGMENNITIRNSRGISELITSRYAGIVSKHSSLFTVFMISIEGNVWESRMDQPSL